MFRHVTQPGQPYPQQPYGQQTYQQPYQQTYGHLPPYTQPPVGYPAAQTAGAPVGTAHLRVHLQGSVLTSSMITPTLLLNNQQVRASYGANDYHLPAGQYHVSAYAQWMRQYGQAAVDLVLAPGQVVDVFYAAPMHQFTTGSMGFTKQRRKGVGLVVGLFAVLALMILAPIVVGLAYS